METIKNELKAYCELHWWNMGKKTLYFKGELRDLLKNQGITYTKKKTETEGVYIFNFKNEYGISYKRKTTTEDFIHQAKKFIQMELVRMGDKSQLYVSGSWRPTVTVNHQKMNEVDKEFWLNWGECPNCLNETSREELEANNVLCEECNKA